MIRNIKDLVAGKVFPEVMDGLLVFDTDVPETRQSKADFLTGWIAACKAAKAGIPVQALIAAARLWADIERTKTDGH